MLRITCEYKYVRLAGCQPPGHEKAQYAGAKYPYPAAPARSLLAEAEEKVEPERRGQASNSRPFALYSGTENL